MARTRAERRFKKALIKQRVWNRSAWNGISKQDETWSSSKRAFVPTDEEFVKNCLRRAFRNEGKWRHKGKKWYGCSYNCHYCNPQIRLDWYRRDITELEMSFDILDFEESLQSSD